MPSCAWAELLNVKKWKSPIDFQDIWKHCSSFVFLVRCLQCWLCKADDHGPLSFQNCDENKENESCKANPEPSCGTFLYTNKQGRRIHARSCVHQQYCGANDTFCREISLGGTDCRLQCCTTDFCNYHENGFASTMPPVYEDEDEDCSWIDAGSTPGLSRVLLLACALVFWIVLFR